MLRKLIRVIFFGRIFIGLCAVATCIQTNILLHTSLNNLPFYSFIFGATLFQYNLPYIVELNKHKTQSGLLFLTPISFHHWLSGAGLILTAISFFDLTIWQMVMVAGIGILTVMYSFNLLPFTGKRLKDFGFVKIFTLTILWVAVTVLLPAIGKPVATASVVFLCVLRLLYLWILCLLFDIRDIGIDNRAGIKTIPVLLGKHNTRLLCYSLTAVFMIMAIFFAWQTQTVFVLNAYVISVLATFFIIRLANTNTNTVFYLSCVDGLMLLQAMLIIIGSI